MTRKALALCALLASACGHLDEVDVTRSGTATVPGAPGGAPLPATAVAIDLPIGREVLAQQGIDPNDVDSARLVAFRLEVLSGSSFEKWLDSVAFHVEAPGLPRALVAQKRSIRSLPAGTNAVSLDVSGVDLKPYVLVSGAKVTAEVAGIEPEQDTTVRATATVRVDVNVSGLLR